MYLFHCVCVCGFACWSCLFYFTKWKFVLIFVLWLSLDDYRRCFCYVSLYKNAWVFIFMKASWNIFTKFHPDWFLSLVQTKNFLNRMLFGITTSFIFKLDDGFFYRFFLLPQFRIYVIIFWGNKKRFLGKRLKTQKDSLLFSSSK